MVEEENMELVSFAIVAAAGQARSLAMDAIAKARCGDREEARKLLDESREVGIQAHDEQTKLLSREADGDHVPVDVLLVHSQDHLMTSMLCQDLAEEIVALYERIDGE